MASVMSFDELNKLITKPKALPYEKYFGEMGISKQQKNKRIKLAEEFDELFIEILAEEFYSLQEGVPLTKGHIKEAVKYGYWEIAKKHDMDKLPLMEEYVEDFAEDFARVTVNRAETPYFLSKDRAMYNAENESNTLYNHEEFVEALKKNKRKKWNAIIDEVTRQNHADADGQVVDIDRPFRVGDSLLMYPKDTSLGATDDEVINCRCWATYF